MINIDELINNEQYQQGILNKGFDKAELEKVIALHEEIKPKRLIVEELRSQKNIQAKQIGKAKPEERSTLLEEAQKLKTDLDQKETELKALVSQYEELIASVPIPADSSVPIGNEDLFDTIKTWGETKSLRDMAGELDHGDLGASRDWFDSAKAVELSGSRFLYFKKEIVQLEFALINFALQKLMKIGFTPVIPPVMVREEAMYNSGFFPGDRSTAYKLEDDDLYLIGTSEVALNGLHTNEIIDEDQLPLKYCGYSTSFRREAGTYGKDTKGSFRVHQFDKLEMFYYVNPKDSWETLEEILAIQEEIVQELELPYRVIACASEDLGAPAAKKYDIEVWLPSEERYREVTSTSNYLDFTSRRSRVRYKAEDGKNHLVHTLNGTAVSISRLLCFILEHWQTAEGKLNIPKAMEPFLGVKEL
jgi:seryl-tRNA synthetase